MRSLIPLAAAALLTGCATLDPAATFAPVQQAVRQQVGAELRWARSDADRESIGQRVSGLLAAPLDADTAVQLHALSRDALAAVSAADPLLGQRLMRNIALHLSQRLRGADWAWRAASA